MKKLVQLVLLGLVIFSANNTQAQAESNESPHFVVQGKIQDAYTQNALGENDINFNLMGPSVLSAELDNRGNFTIVFNKDEVSFPMRMKFKVDGYKKFVARRIDPDENTVWLDVDLEPVDRDETADATSPEKRYYTTTMVLQP